MTLERTSGVKLCHINCESRGYILHGIACHLSIDMTPHHIFRIMHAQCIVVCCSSYNCGQIYWSQGWFRAGQGTNRPLKFSSRWHRRLCRRRLCRRLCTDLGRIFHESTNSIQDSTVAVPVIVYLLTVQTKKKQVHCSLTRTSHTLGLGNQLRDSFRWRRRL